MRRWWMVLAVLGCDDGGGGGAPERDAAIDAAPRPRDAGEPDAIAELPDAGDRVVRLEAVSGELVYATLGPSGGHLFSVQADGNLRQQLTSERAHWTFAAVGGPDPHYIASVRLDDAGRGSVWVIDVKQGDAWAISPPECDAGLGGVGWLDRVRVMFAMDCGDGPSQAWISLYDNRARDRAAMIQVTSHEEPVRDVFPAFTKSLFTYVVDKEVCDDGCVLKPQIWVADDTGANCQLTDGDLGFTDVGTLTAAGRRLGDHNPTFNGDLSEVTFSRNVGEKPGGPTGHHDLMRVGFDARRLGQPTCNRPETLENVTESSLDEVYRSADGDEVVGDERFPQGSSGRAPERTLLYTAQTHAAGGTSVVWVVGPGGTTALTPTDGRAGYARWIDTGDFIDGER